MVVVLSVAEKPSVAKELANIIGKGNAQKRNGRSQYNHVFDIQNCEFNGGHADMKMTSVLGHMMELEFQEEYRKWSSCNPEDLFTAPVNKSVKKDMENVARTLAEEARKCSVLLLWLDCDLEGENIAFEVIKICTEANPRLNIYRAQFSALIPRDVFATLRAPQRPNPHMSDAVDARQEIDLRLGAAFTRFQTLKLQSKYQQLSKVVVSYGPCQFPTLGFVVDRYLKRQGFIPEDFWSISCEVESSDPDEASGVLTSSFRWKRGNVFDRLSCILLYELSVEAGSARVIECSAREALKHKPCPLNTIELQKRASRFLRISSDDTMSAAESLYQKGILSYPRTETDFFKEGFELIPLIQDHRNHPDWGQFTLNLLENNGYEHPKNGGHDDQAHPPIHPTKSIPLGEIGDPRERAIYELVTRHFLACCSKDAVGDQTTVQIQFEFSSQENFHDSTGSMDRPELIIARDRVCSIAANSGYPGEIFEATGLMIRERNWLNVYRWGKWYASKILSVRVGDIVRPKRLEMTEGRTVAPPPISESDLISEMDANGIGTDATIATHIKTIQDRNYAVKDEDARFIPTELGIALVEGYNKMGYQLNKPYLRAAMEKDCQKVAKGELSKAEMLNNCLREMKECFKCCRRDVGKLEEAIEKYVTGATNPNHHQTTMQLIGQNFSKCGKCSNYMDLRANGHQNEQGYLRGLTCKSCSQTHMLPSRGEASAHSHMCPICNFQVLSIKNTESGKMYTLCPMCYKNPPGPPDSEEGIIEMRCFSCSHDCPLASMVSGGNTVVAPCADINCRDGGMKLKKNDKGYMLGCFKYPTCRFTWWLPKFIKTAGVDLISGPCQRCKISTGYSVSKISISVNMSLAPPGTPPQSSVCPVCDRIWGDIMCEPLKLPTKAGHANTNNPNLGYFKATKNNVSRDATMVIATSNREIEYASNAARNINWHAKDGLGYGESNIVSERYTSGEGSNISATNFSTTSNYGAAAIGGESYATSSRGKRGGGVASGRGGNGGRGGFNQLEDENAPLCLCGDKSASRTVTKEGPNKGRGFRVCPKTRGEGCNFFEWADDSGSSSSMSSSGRGMSNSHRGGGTIAGAAPRNNVICTKCKGSGHYARQCPSNY